MPETKPKKILIAVPSLECGGLERNVSILCNNIDTKKYHVTLVVLNNVNQFFEITNKDIKVVDLGIVNVRKSLFSILKISRQIKPDIILTTANHLNLLFAIFKWMFPKRIKIIARESSIVSVNTQRTWNPRVYHWLLRTFYKKIDMIVCQSEYMRQDLLQHYHIKDEKSCIIYNPVTLPEAYIDHQPGVSYASLITVARLSKEKGIDRLIRAVSLLKKPYRFTIIGEGNMRPKLEKMIEDMSLKQQVFLAGSNARPFTLVPGIDLFLMGSYYEGFPNAMLEATAAGIPVVAFNVPGGIAELLMPGENGILVEGNDEKAYAEAIQQALDFPFNKQQIQDAALKRFNINGIMNEWYAVLK